MHEVQAIPSVEQATNDLRIERGKLRRINAEIATLKGQLVVLNEVQNRTEMEVRRLENTLLLAVREERQPEDELAPTSSEKTS